MKKQETILQLSRVCNYYQYPTSKKNYKIVRKFDIYQEKDENKLFTYTFNGYPVSKYMYNYLYMVQIGRENNLDNYEKRDIQSFFQKKWISILNDDVAIDLPAFEKEIQEIKKRSAEEYELNIEKFKTFLKNASQKTLIPEENLTFPARYEKIYYTDDALFSILNKIVKNYSYLDIDIFDSILFCIKDKTILNKLLSLRNIILDHNELVILPKKVNPSEVSGQDITSSEEQISSKPDRTSCESPDNLLMLCSVSELFQPISGSEENDLKRFKK